ncbi:hypothetical protein FRC11_011563, partial [Ceratobasidium sp. 423]
AVSASKLPQDAGQEAAPSRRGGQAEAWRSPTESEVDHRRTYGRAGFVGQATSPSLQRLECNSPQFLEVRCRFCCPGREIKLELQLIIFFLMYSSVSNEWIWYFYLFVMRKTILSIECYLMTLTPTKRSQSLSSEEEAILPYMTGAPAKPHGELRLAVHLPKL